MYNEQTLYAESGSYRELESRSTINSSQDDDVNWVVLGPIVGVAAALVMATLIIIATIYCYCHGNKGKKSATLPARDFIVVHKQ